MNQEKRYKIEFSRDWIEIEGWAKKGDSFWKNKLESDTGKEQLTMCKKWKGKTITLDELPSFVAEVRMVVLTDDTVEVYNDYRE